MWSLIQIFIYFKIFYNILGFINVFNYSFYWRVKNILKYLFIRVFLIFLVEWVKKFQTEFSDPLEKSKNIINVLRIC